MKKILDAISLAVPLLFIIAGAALYIAPHFGWYVDGMRTSSMTPEIQRGALVIARPIDPQAVKLNDIIIYHPVAIGENLLCHRVIDIQQNSPPQFQTKGDAQDTPDPLLVPARNIVGKVLSHVSLLGFAAIFLKTPAGFLLSLVIPGIAISLICLGDIRAELAKRKRKTSVNEQTI